MKESVKSFLKDVFHGEKHPKHRLGKMSDKKQETASAGQSID
jgi:hypothetical protein